MKKIILSLLVAFMLIAGTGCSKENLSNKESSYIYELKIKKDKEFINDILKIETYVDEKRINCLRRKDYDFARKINEKFLK